MQPIDQALEEVRNLHRELIRQPAPEIGPQAFLPFPPGQDPVAFAIDEVNRLKQLVRSRNETSTQTWVPRASVFAGEGSLRIVVELAGLEKDQVDVSVSDGALVVRGTREAGRFAGLQPVMLEQPWGMFERRFPLPAWAGADSVKACYAQGVLEIEVTRPESETGEIRVEIK